MDLSEEQQNAFDKYIQRKNIFITGPGGTGKSTLIKQLQADAKKRLLNMQVCALTGCAAVLLDCKAKTIHSWSGIGLGSGTISFNVKKVVSSSYKKKSWRNVDILVIDEVSMMSEKIFEMLDAIGKATRQNNRPFGGIQVIFLGDFYQLPPVGNRDEPETIHYCFESPSWRDTFEKENVVQLTKIFRQTDVVYTKILNQIREGRVKKSSNDLLMSLVGKQLEEGALIQPTKLFPVRIKVDAINAAKMAELETPELEFSVKYTKSSTGSDKNKSSSREYTPEQIDNEIKNINNNLLCNDIIKLKVGAQVMCIVNIELPSGDMICNGSQGVIIRFNESKLPVVKYKNGYEMTMNYHFWESDNISGIGVSQVPLILAWAITIHKSQGATMDAAEIDVGSGIFECGQTYVALSRVKSLEGLYLTSFDASKILINKKVREFYDNLT
jgi:ATP-dependent DNA helicase PIF1